MARAPESPPLPAPRAPSPLRPALRALPYSEPRTPAPQRVCEPVTWFPLQPSRQSTSAAAAAAKSRQTPLRQGRSEEMASRPHAQPPPPPPGWHPTPPARLPPGSLTCPALQACVPLLRVYAYTIRPARLHTCLPRFGFPPRLPVPAVPSTQGALPRWRCCGGFGGRASTHPAARSRRFWFGCHSSSRQRGRNGGQVRGQGGGDFHKYGLYFARPGHAPPFFSKPLVARVGSTQRSSYSWGLPSAALSDVLLPSPPPGNGSLENSWFALEGYTLTLLCISWEMCAGIEKPRVPEGPLY